MKPIIVEAQIFKKNRKTSLFKIFIQQWDLQLFVLIPLLLVFIFQYVPMWGVLMAFQNYDLFKGFSGSPWVGLENFEAFFNASDFWLIMRNTICISLFKLIVGFPAPILLALMLNEVRHNWFKRTIQTISYLPHFISWVIISGMVISMLAVDNGSLNIVMEKLSLIKEPVNWLSIPEYFWTILVATGVWKDIGFGAIIYLAAIVGVDPHMYEAAQIDGASRLQQIFLITIPSIAPIIIIFLILNISNILNAGFEDILLLTNQGHNAILRPTSDVIDTYVYRIGIENSRYSYATAVGIFKAIISVGLLIVANSISRRLGKASLW